MRHTLLPWKLLDADSEVLIIGAGSQHVATVHHYHVENARNISNAEFIVHAVNHHEMLVAALRAMTDHFGVLDDNPMLHETARSATKKARAALKKVMDKP